MIEQLFDLLGAMARYPKTLEREDERTRSAVGFGQQLNLAPVPAILSRCGFNVRNEKEI